MREKVREIADPEDRVYWMVRWLQDNQHRINDFKKGKEVRTSLRICLQNMIET